MSKLWSSSIGKKLVMSLSGLFLVIFLLVYHFNLYRLNRNLRHEE